MIVKPWGWEELVENDKYVVKKLFMKKGCQCSLQYHEKKKETVFVLMGKLTIVDGEGKEKVLAPFTCVTINPKEVHRMKAVDEDCLYLECSTTELDDVVRLEDSYGRV